MHFRKELDKLKLEGYMLVIGKSIKSGIVGMDVNVILSNEKEEHLIFHKVAIRK